MSLHLWCVAVAMPSLACILTSTCYFCFSSFEARPTILAGTAMWHFLLPCPCFYALLILPGHSQSLPLFLSTAFFFHNIGSFFEDLQQITFLYFHYRAEVNTFAAQCKNNFALISSNSPFITNVSFITCLFKSWGLHFSLLALLITGNSSQLSPLPYFIYSSLSQLFSCLCYMRPWDAETEN